jgi:phosphopantothenoylcysteine decarboxylase/phosphopantothenate--cysteine ligase
MTKGIDCVNVQTAAQLGQVLSGKRGSYDILVMAAAVADFRPVEFSEAKLKRSEVGESLELQLIANPDLLAQTVSALNEEGSRAVVVGFAAEASAELEELGRRKLDSKGCHYIVANNISSSMVFGKDETEVVLVSKDSVVKLSGSKQDVAAAVLSQIASNMVES